METEEMIRHMPASPDMDKLIFQYIFNNQIDETEISDGVFIVKENSIMEVPKYSSISSDAEEIVKYYDRLGINIQIRSPKIVQRENGIWKREGNWQCSLDGTGVNSEGETEPLALCRMALLYTLKESNGIP